MIGVAIAAPTNSNVRLRLSAAWPQPNVGMWKRGTSNVGKGANEGSNIETRLAQVGTLSYILLFRSDREQGAF